MKPRFPFGFCLGLLALLPARIFAQGISFDLQVDLLQTATPGVPLPTSGLVLLVADTGRGGFGAVAATSIGSDYGSALALGLALNGAGGDDLILWRGDLTGNATPGLLADMTSSLARGTYGSLTWDTGDPLALFWFPNLTLSSTATTAGTPYGLLIGASAPEGEAWITSGDASAYRLYFITTNNTGMTGIPGISDPGLLVASYNVAAIPEPGTSAALAGLAALGLTAVRRRWRRARRLVPT